MVAQCGSSVEVGFLFGLFLLCYCVYISPIPPFELKIDSSYMVVDVVRQLFIFMKMVGRQ